MGFESSRNRYGKQDFSLNRYIYIYIYFDDTGSSRFPFDKKIKESVCITNDPQEANVPIIAGGC